MLSVDCLAIYKPKSINYDIFAKWSLDDPLAMEAAAVNGYRIRIQKYPVILKELQTTVCEQNII